jgi:ribosomal protein L12E/L44/L45/RPP1/RPP2
MTDPIAHYDNILTTALRTWIDDAQIEEAIPAIRTALFAAGCGAFSKTYTAATHAPYELAAIEAARQSHEKEGELEFDDSPLVSRNPDGGAYVMAWVWIPDDEIDCPEDDEEGSDG